MMKKTQITKNREKRSSPTKELTKQRSEGRLESRRGESWASATAAKGQRLYRRRGFNDIGKNQRHEISNRTA
ncbi:hypothetical protein SLE2022_189160 [Rubroshorea leprosula]